MPRPPFVARIVIDPTLWIGMFQGQGKGFDHSGDHLACHPIVIL